MNIEEVRSLALIQPGVTEDTPFGDDIVVFRIKGKIFMCLSLENQEPHFALKLHPERNEELRAMYDEVVPAWHWNKKHWSDVYYKSGLTDHLIEEWIRESYKLVLSSLPKRLRSKYMSETNESKHQ